MKTNPKSKVCFWCGMNTHMLDSCPTKPDKLPKKLPFYKAVKVSRPKGVRKPKGDQNAKNVFRNNTFNGTVNFK